MQAPTADADPMPDEAVRSSLGPHPVSVEAIRDACNSLKASLSVTEEVSRCIEKETCGQSNSTKWFEYRKFRLTASVMHKVVSMRKTTNPKVFLDNKLYCKDRFQGKAMKQGIERETAAAQRYKLHREKEEGEDITLQDTGLRISTDKGFIGASADCWARPPGRN